MDLKEPYLILVDVTWRLGMGASISSPSSDKIIVYTVKNGTIMFHKTVVTTPTEVETNYNNAIDTTHNIDWEKIGIVSLYVLGGILIVTVLTNAGK